MQLVEYARILRRRWVLLLVGLVACIAGAAIATSVQTKTYTASTRLIVSGSSSVGTVDEIAQRQLGGQRALAYAQIAPTPPAVQAAVRAAGLSGANVSVSASANGTDPFLTISVKGPDAAADEKVANAYVGILPATLAALEQSTGSDSGTIKTLSAAGLPGSPTSPRPTRNLLIGFGLGIVVGLAGAFGAEAIDRRLRSVDEVEELTELPVLGAVPQELGKEKLVAATMPRSGRAEAYRMVRTNLQFVDGNGAPRSILVTSSSPGEGKTSLATNLAVSCADSGERVVLVDADLRRPMVHTYFGTPQDGGLTEVLRGTLPLADALRRTDHPNVVVLSAGRLPSNPSELLGSTAMATVLRELQGSYDRVVIDSPPVLPVADAVQLAALSSCVVLVARMRLTTAERLRRACDILRKVDARLVGVVTNGVRKVDDSGYGYGYGYSSAVAPGPARPPASAEGALAPAPAGHVEGAREPDESLDLTVQATAPTPVARPAETPRTPRLARPAAAPPTAANGSARNGTSNGRPVTRTPLGSLARTGEPGYRPAGTGSATDEAEVGADPEAVRPR